MSKSQSGQKGHRSERPSEKPFDENGNVDRRRNKQDRSKEEPEEERAKLSIEMDDKGAKGNVASPESGKNDTVTKADLISREGKEIYNEEEDDHEAENSVEDDDNEEGDAEREQRMRKRFRENK